MTQRLLALFEEQGQSPWLDNLQRGYITTGQLEQLIASGIRGLTSNPTIFQKAIQSSTDYDEQFANEIKSGNKPEDAYWSLVISTTVETLWPLRVHWTNESPDPM